MNYIGVDNGVSGGMVMVSHQGKLMYSCAMHIQKTRKGNEVNVLSMKEILEQWIRDIPSYDQSQVTVVIEEPGGSKSAKAATSMAGAFHAMRALFEIAGLRLLRITPQQWQKSLLKCKTGDTKPVALQMAKTLWPQENFKRTSACRTADMGIVDAALIAEWARRNNL